MSRPHPRMASARKNGLAVYLFTAASLAVMYSPQSVLNELCSEFAIGRSTSSLVITVFLFVLGCAPLLAGGILARFGLRRILFAACTVMAVSSAGIALAPGFGGLLVVRCCEALCIPFILTGVLSALACIFRHMDPVRALSFYAACQLGGTLCGRIGGGIIAQYAGWRPALVFFLLAYVPCLWLLRSLPEPKGRSQPPAISLSALVQTVDSGGFGLLLAAEACTFFVFAGISNLIPFRMTDLGHGDSTALIGLMYVGSSIGLAATMLVSRLRALAGSDARLLAAGILLYLLSFPLAAAPSVWILFACLWLVTFSQFILHALTPGVINRMGNAAGCNRSVVSGIFLSCYYLGGALGTWLPGIVFGIFGWTATCLFMEAVLGFALLCILRHRSQCCGRMH